MENKQNNLRSRSTAKKRNQPIKTNKFSSTSQHNEVPPKKSQSPNKGKKSRKILLKEESKEKSSINIKMNINSINYKPPLELGTPGGNVIENETKLIKETTLRHLNKINSVKLG
jgi:hypothetical protein